MSLFSLALAGAALFAARVSAHGIATAMVHWPGGIFYHGYDPSYQYDHPVPVVIAWSIPKDLTNSFIPPSKYQSPEIICHIDATNAGLAAPVDAGDILEFQWNKWPASHKGPVINYLANCHGPCEKADKTKLEFFKIAEVGLVDAAANEWAADELRKNNLSWSVRLPEDIAPGNYVLRHEMIALHTANNVDGAQNYPFCYNLVISGNGTSNPAGVLATDLYKERDPGILFDLFASHSTYTIPGPTLYSGALTVAQTKPGAIEATSSGVYSYVAPASASSAVVLSATATATATPTATAAGAARAIVRDAHDARDAHSAAQAARTRGIEADAVDDIANDTDETPAGPEPTTMPAAFLKARYSGRQ